MFYEISFFFYVRDYVIFVSRFLDVGMSTVDIEVFYISYIEFYSAEGIGMIMNSSVGMSFCGDYGIEWFPSWELL